MTPEHTYYIAGPMTGYEEFNYPAFYRMEDQLALMGHGSINPAAHICVDCGGELVLSQTGGTASVHLGYVSLQPDSWGKYKGLPVNKYVAESLEDMGLQMIRE